VRPGHVSTGRHSRRQTKVVLVRKLFAELAAWNEKRERDGWGLSAHRERKKCRFLSAARSTGQLNPMTEKENDASAALPSSENEFVIAVQWKRGYLL
jgi:hypothetical protein